MSRFTPGVPIHPCWGYIFISFFPLSFDFSFIIFLIRVHDNYSLYGQPQAYSSYSSSTLCFKFYTNCFYYICIGLCLKFIYNLYSFFLLFRFCRFRSVKLKEKKSAMRVMKLSKGTMNENGPTRTKGILPNRVPSIRHWARRETWIWSFIYSPLE